MSEIKFRCWFNYQMWYAIPSIEWGASGIMRVNLNHAEGDFDLTPDTWTGYNDYALMQYTGLKDKNGREIYEGDIVRYKCKSLDLSWDEVKPIEWRHGAYRFGNFTIGANMPGALEDYEHQPYLEVIGNIHENPELLA